MPKRILIVDDEPNIVLSLEFLMTQAGYEVETAGDGDAAIQAVADKPPDLILLDLNLPKKDGRQVLMEIKSDDRLKSIPVVILTTSSSDEDILHSYKHYANCFVTKPLDLKQFFKVVKSIKDFWVSIVVLPQKGDKR